MIEIAALLILALFIGLTAGLVELCDRLAGWRTGGFR